MTYARYLDTTTGEVVYGDSIPRTTLLYGRAKDGDGYRYQPAEGALALGQWLARNGGILPGERPAEALERLQQPGQQWCDASGRKPLEDGSYHHLVPRPVKGGGNEHRCNKCDRTEKALRELAIR